LQYCTGTDGIAALYNLSE